MWPEHGDLGLCRIAGGLRLLALPLSRRQASVLLAADQPDGAAAVFALPFFQLYSAVGLFDTHIAVALAHCLFNVPLAVWILEGFMSRRAQGDRRDRLYRRLFVPAVLREDLHAADRVGHRRRRLLLLHVLWVELLLARTLTTTDGRSRRSTRMGAGVDWGVLAHDPARW
jgi:glycerol transport system permease protein